MKKLVCVLVLAVLAVSAWAEITYPVDVENTRWALYDMSTGEVLHRQQVWPRADGMPVEGMATNLVYLLHIDDAIPQYDQRVFVLHSTETIDPPENEIRKTHEAQRRSVAEILTAAENVEAEQLAVLIRLQREVIETRLTLGAIIKYALKNQVFPAKAQALIDEYEVKAVKVWNNRDRLTELKAAIEAGDDFDLDAGWEAAQ